jgi:PAS domain S-box-containing protein
MFDAEKSKKRLLIELNDVRQKMSEHEVMKSSLEETQRKYRALFNALPLGITISNRSGKIVESNTTAEALLGFYRDDQGFRQGGSTVHYNGTQMPPLEYIRELSRKENRRAENVEVEVVRANGEVACVDVSVVPIHPGRSGLIITYDDITERKALERRLRESEEKFRKLFQSLPLATVITSVEEGRLLEANDAFMRIMGCAGSEASLVSMLEPDIWAFPEERLQYASSLKKNLAVENFEALLRTRSGRTITVLINGELVESSGEKWIISSCLDISEQKRLAGDLAATASRLEDMNAALRVLLEQRELERREMERRVRDNMRILVSPYLEAIRTENPSTQALCNLDLALKAFEGITSGFVRTLHDEYRALTGREIRVADMIRSDMTSKEIAGALGISTATANFYRASIRRKLGLVGKKEKLSAFLLALPDGKAKS